MESLGGISNHCPSVSIFTSPPNRWPAQLQRGTLRELPSSRCVPRPITATQPPNSGWRHFEPGRSSSSSQPSMKAPSRTRRVVEVSWSLRQAASGDWD